MRLLLAVCLLQFQRASPQFPEHKDFQKLGEVFYKGEKYNILKETTHSMRDHFKDFMEKRKSEDFPTKKIFLDKYGFRHYWSGLYDTENFRKVGIDRENALELLKQNKADINSEMRIQYGKLKSKQEEIARHIRRKLNNVDKIMMKQILRQKKNETKTTKKPSKAKGTETTKTKDKPKDEKTTTKATNKPTTKKIIMPKDMDQNIIMTQFYCPYFGVMTLTSALD